ncbi:fimbria/pilus chaperone family protein [Escherichia coli]|nr:fimbria/pilus periplasmic chaperone [Escherichia coli]EFF1360426.1 fimbria/pilus periplasmic chaperone [Escherichia coli]EFI4199028.1 fimbria/pilus periplasmic chaperone [Escherichia coli]EFI4245256.1 fimbria/pilus periplasmic chaperone [Escherichia coli]EFI5850338.1 fimbria/pilus periplasmic chaperone [Escherichia coli]
MIKYVLTSLAICPLFAHAAGMVPETSVLLVDERKGEASINVTNTDTVPQLLYTTVVELPGEHKTTRLIPTQPVVRVEAGQIQRVRFMLQTDAPLKSEEMKRVTFEGIPPKTADNKNQVTLSIRQDLPVLIHPASLAEDLEPWKQLQWRKKGNMLEVSNPSDYVVRLTPQFRTLPSGASGSLNRTYMLPHTTLSVDLPSGKDDTVEFYPASRYGYRGDKFQTELN